MRTIDVFFLLAGGGMTIGFLMFMFFVMDEISELKKKLERKS